MNERNTVIRYIYRDAANYKTSNVLCVNGLLSAEQVARIMDCLDDGEYFIPERLGFEASRWNEFDPDLDHVWCELNESDFNDEEFPYTEDISPEELVRRFETMKGRWEETPRPFDWCLPVPCLER